MERTQWQWWKSSRVLFIWIAVVCVTCLYVMQPVGIINFFPSHYFKFEIIRGSGHSSEVTEESPGCSVPVLNPWDESILHLLQKKPKLECRVIQPFLTSINSSGFLLLNSTEVQRINALENCSPVECIYQEFHRTEQNEQDVNFGDRMNLTADSKISDEFVYVKCAYQCQKGNETITYNYTNVHAYVNETKINYELLNKTLKEQINYYRPNMFSLGLDSMSASNFKRQLPRVMDFLVRNLSAVEMKGMTRNAHSTFKNMVALLTGCVVTDDLTNPKGPYDNWPFVWNNFSDAGYVTAFGEDCPKGAIFNYLRKGFVKQPTDFYMRPYWQVQVGRGKTLLDMSTHQCFGNFPRHTPFLEWTKEIFKKFGVNNNNAPYYVFDYLTDLSHDDVNEAQIFEDDLLSFLIEIAESGLMDDTILMIHGDHGMRYGDFRQTPIGRVEENMPFFSIVLPRKLDILFPYLRRNLQMNANRMVTWFDIHELLMDVAKHNYDGKVDQWVRHGHSPFRPIPLNRTCEQAAILENYCTCYDSQNLSVDQSEVKEAASELVATINNMLAPYQDLCANRSLTNSTRAELIQLRRNESSTLEFPINIRLQIATSPANAIFEAVVRKSDQTAKFKVVDNIDRVNMYRYEATCFKNLDVEKFCYCKNNENNKKKNEK